MHGWWFSELLHDDPVRLVAICFWVIGSICLHELAHGWAAIRVGDRTPIETGHMTWNPLVHMGWVNLIVFVVVGITWGAMPVNPSRFRGRFAESFVALAGPAVNLVLAVFSGICAGIVMGLQPFGHPVQENVSVFFEVGTLLNFVLLFLNLLPIPPLDGSRAAADLIPAYRRLLSSPKAGMAGLLLLVLLVAGGADWLFVIAEIASIMVIGPVLGIIELANGTL